MIVCWPMQGLLLARAPPAAPEDTHAWSSAGLAPAASGTAPASPGLPVQGLGFPSPVLGPAAPGMAPVSPVPSSAASRSRTPSDAGQPCVQEPMLGLGFTNRTLAAAEQQQAALQRMQEALQQQYGCLQYPHPNPEHTPSSQPAGMLESVRRTEHLMPAFSPAGAPAGACTRADALPAGMLATHERVQESLRQARMEQAIALLAAYGSSQPMAVRLAAAQIPVSQSLAGLTT